MCKALVRLIVVGALAATGAAHAADMRPVLKAPPKPIAVVYNWSGFYIGAHVGGASTDKQWNELSGAELVSYNASGIIGGSQIGFNWQTGNWVFGAEAQGSAASIRKGELSRELFIAGILPYIEQDNRTVVLTKRIGTTVEHLGSIAGRVGYAFDNVLVFGKAGGAWVHDVYRALNANTATETLLASASSTRWGWMAGAGVEWGFAPNWSAKIEFDYLDFGNKQITLNSIPGITPAARAFDIEQQIALVKVGVNYRFTWR